MTIKLDDQLSLEILSETHASSMFKLIDDNRLHLRAWLPWVDQMRSLDHFLNHLTDCKKRQADGTDFAFSIIYNNEIAGRIGIHYIDQQNKTASLGYWLGAGYQGKGIIQKACKALIGHCFTILNMNRVQIKCATQNIKSKAIAEKLNFTLEGTLREAELVNGIFLDIFLYSMIKNDWKY